MPGTREDKDERHEGSRSPSPQPGRIRSHAEASPAAPGEGGEWDAGVRRESIDLTADNRMNEREQRTARTPFLTRKRTVSGGQAARTPGDLQGSVKVEPQFAKTIGRREPPWAMRRHTKRCRRPGLEETR